MKILLIVCYVLSVIGAGVSVGLVFHALVKGGDEK